MGHQEKLRKAGLPERQSMLAHDLACPVDWEKEPFGPAEPIFLMKWYHTVADPLPNGAVDARLLLASTRTMARSRSSQLIGGCRLAA